MVVNKFLDELTLLEDLKITPDMGLLTLHCIEGKMKTGIGSICIFIQYGDTDPKSARTLS